MTDEGTLYFIGATCGRKRYDPYNRTKMDSYYDKHQVENYFDLFTGFFGQPGAPSYTRFTVKSDGIELNSFTADKDGNAKPLNTMRVVRNTPHTAPSGVMIPVAEPEDGQKFFQDGMLFIRRDGKTYNVLGQQVK